MYMPGRSICCLGRLSQVKAFGEHACLYFSFGSKRCKSSYIDEPTSPETEEPPSLQFRDRRRVEGKVDQILFAFDVM